MDVRDRAKAEGKHLIAIEATHENGKPAVTYYAPATADEARQIIEFITKFSTDRKAKSHN